MIPKYAFEALGKSVVRDEGNRIQLSAALRKGAGRTNTSHVQSRHGAYVHFRDQIMQRMLPEKPMVMRAKNLKPESSQ